MENYYFTFGQIHCTTSGVPMKDYWIRVTASSYGKAREIFIEKFSKVEMEAPDKWAFQYEADKFDSALFPKGEYAHFEEDLKEEAA